MKENINWIVKPSNKNLLINEKDKKLIKIISVNSRASLKEIGKKLNLSKVAVYNRIKNLEKKEIINGYSCLINFSKLGFSTYQIGIKTNMSLEEKEDYLKRIQKCGYVHQILKLSGRKWDFLIRILIKENKINNVLDIIKDSKIQKEEILKISNLLDGGIKETETNLIEKKKKELSKEEINLLLELAKNSRQSLVDLSIKTKLSPKTIINKIKSFEKDKTIITFLTKYNPLIYGEEGYLLVITTKNRKIQEKISKQLTKINSTGVLINIQNPNIISFHIISQLNDLKKIENSLKPFFNEIREYEFIRVEEQNNYNFFPEEILKTLNKNK